MFHVEKMEVADFPFAVQLANSMNWNMTIEDFEFMTKLEPNGCFVLFHNKERSGIVTSVSFGKAGWFGNLVVKEHFRSEGAGNLLTKHALRYLRITGVETIGIYAYKHLVNFYEKFGFESDIDFVVLKGKVKFSSKQTRLEEARKRDIPEIINFDRQWFGANRKKLLEAILLSSKNLCYISTENNKITGYVVAKVYGKTAEIGPLMCPPNHEEGAVILLANILHRLNGIEVFIYIPKKMAELLKMLTKAGFKENFRVVRMFLGSGVAQNCIYTAESLERG